jgi:hypothetical protein
MRTDGLFTVKQIDINDWRGSDKLTILPFGDVHFDSPSFCRNTWDEFLDHAKSLPQNRVLYVGMGDYLDGYSTSERMVLGDSRLHESSVARHDDDAMRRLEKFAKEIEFMRGKLVMLGGNHFYQFGSGVAHGDERLAGMLDAAYLGACAFLRVVFRRAKTTSTVPLDLFLHHGKGGGGKKATGKFHAVEDMAGFADADIYLMGDNHARGCFPLNDRLRLAGAGPSGLRVKAKRSWIGRTGAFLKSYEPGNRNYVVDACMSPSNLGWIQFDVQANLVAGKDRRPFGLNIKGIA